MKLDRGLRHMAEQAADGACATHAVPVVAQATGRQSERIAGIARFGDGLESDVRELRLAVGRRKHAIFVEALLAARLALSHRPLEWTGFERRVAHAGDVEVAALR